MQSPGDITVHNAVSAPKLRGFMMGEGGREESGTNHIITAEAHRGALVCMGGAEVECGP